MKILFKTLLIITCLSLFSACSDDDNPITNDTPSPSPTEEKLDKEKPVVKSIVPKGDATSIALYANVVVTFSEAIDASSVDDKSVALTTPSLSSNVKVSIKVTDNVMTIDPSVSFKEGAVYTLTLAAEGVKDLAGNGLESAFVSSFTAEVLDTESPSVVSFSVTNGETGVNANEGITVTFSEPMDPDSFDGNLLFRRGGTTDFLPISFEVSGNDVMITPDETMKGNTEYVLDVTVDVTDLAGNKLIFAKGRVFTTAEVPLTILSTTPEDDAINVEVDQEIIITFSEPIEESTVSIFWAGSGPSFTTSIDGSVLTITVDGDGLTEFETNYTLSISSAEDIYGNSLASSQSLDFTTIFVSERYYYFIRNYQTANDRNPEYLGFQQASPQVTYLDNKSQSSNFNLWRFIKNGESFAIRNFYLEDKDFSDQNLYSFPLTIKNTLAYSQTVGSGTLWTFDTPTNGVRTMRSRGNLFDGQNLTMTSDQSTSSGYRWWIFSRQPVAVD